MDYVYSSLYPVCYTDCTLFILIQRLQYQPGYQNTFRDSHGQSPHLFFATAAAAGFQAVGCQVSPGPCGLAFAQGSSLPSTRLCRAASCSGLCSCSPGVSSPLALWVSAGRGICSCGTAGLTSSMTRGLASHRASASAARCFILSCLTTSPACSSRDGGSRRVCRSHWCQRGDTLTCE